jgi:hypothetical protein
MRALLGTATGLFLPACWLLMAPLPAAAQQSDAIWACEDDQGHKVFQNVGNGRGCHRIDGVIATIPSPTPPVQRPAPVPSGQNGVSPANFPRVDRDVQRLRDVDRHRILEDELRVEQDHLVRLRADFNNGNPRPQPDETVASATYRERVQRLMEDIQRSEGSIASLKRELAPARY